MILFVTSYLLYALGWLDKEGFQMTYAKVHGQMPVSDKWGKMHKRKWWKMGADRKNGEGFVTGQPNSVDGDYKLQSTDDPVKVDKK